jgi:hypothetical protein
MNTLYTNLHDKKKKNTQDKPFVHCKKASISKKESANKCTFNKQAFHTLNTRKSHKSLENKNGTKGATSKSTNGFPWNHKKTSKSRHANKKICLVYIEKSNNKRTTSPSVIATDNNTITSDNIGTVTDINNISDSIANNNVINNNIIDNNTVTNNITNTISNTTTSDAPSINQSKQCHSLSKSNTSHVSDFKITGSSKIIATVSNNTEKDNTRNDTCNNDNISNDLNDIDPFNIYSMHSTGNQIIQEPGYTSKRTTDPRSITITSEQDVDTCQDHLSLRECLGLLHFDVLQDLSSSSSSLEPLALMDSFMHNHTKNDTQWYPPVQDSTSSLHPMCHAESQDYKHSSWDDIPLHNNINSSRHHNTLSYLVIPAKTTTSTNTVTRPETRNKNINLSAKDRPCNTRKITRETIPRNKCKRLYCNMKFIPKNVYAGNMRKTRQALCEKYYNHGYCSRGSKCTFLHQFEKHYTIGNLGELVSNDVCTMYPSLFYTLFYPSNAYWRVFWHE